MRPNFSAFSKFSTNPTEAAQFGLPQAGAPGYNFRQNLPVAANVVRPGDAARSPELGMKRTTRHSTAASAPAPSAPVTTLETRAERLARIQREIAAGTYETPEKLEAAIDRMLGTTLRD